jgi:hypothetical protein
MKGMTVLTETPSRLSSLSFYSDINGELTAKNTDADVFDAILQMY